MEYFAGLDVSMAETHVCVDRKGAVIHNAKTRRRLRTSRPSLRRFQPAGGSYLRPVEWLRCSITA